MPLLRPVLLDVNQGVQNWQTILNSWRAAAFSTPFPPALYANEGALPSPASYGGCFAVVENFAGTGKPTYAWSDGVGWRFQVVDQYAKENGSTSNGYLDLIRPEMRVAEGFEIDFYLEQNSAGTNTQVAFQVYDSAGTPALVTGNQYALRGNLVYGTSGVLIWDQALGGYAGIGYDGAAHYLGSTEEAFGRIRFTRGPSNSSWHYEASMYYDQHAAPGTGSRRSFSVQGTLVVPGGLLMNGIRLYLRNQATGAVTGTLTTSSRVRVTY